MSIIRALRKEETEGRTRKILQEIKAKIFPKLIKTIHPGIQKVQRTSRTKVQGKVQGTPVLDCLKPAMKKKILKVGGE